MVLQPSPPNTNLTERQTQNRPRPIGLLLNPSGTALTRAGDSIQLTATIANQGSVSAIIDVYIAQTSQPVQQWCRSPHERLALNPGQASEVVFTLVIPSETLPDLYHYSLIVDAPQHYPQDTPIEHRAQLQVTPFISGTQTASDPTFALNPHTDSQTPISLQPGQSLELQATVENRSDRVDRFYLTCPDLDPSQFSVHYPQGTDPPGMVVPNDSLQLNPGESGQILLTLTPAADSWAGTLSPTVQVYSANNPHLTLLDLVYLTIAPVYLVHVELVSIVAKVKREAGLFQVRLSNQGNTRREIAIEANSDQADTPCKQSITPSLVQLLPGESIAVTIAVQPLQKWRPFFGRTIDFSVELHDIQNHPLVNDRFQATLFWEPRPWWQFLALVLLTSVTVAALVFWIWWRLTRPPVRVRVVRFAPERHTYEALNGDVIRLNWTIENPDNLQRLTLVGLSPEGTVTSEPTLYDFNEGIPESLAEFCHWETQLICRGVWTDARQAGDYIFELTTESSHEQAESEIARTQSIQINPLPQPQFEEFSAQLSFEETVLDKNIESEAEVSDRATIVLNWIISHPQQLEELHLVGLDPNGSVITDEIRYNFRQGLPVELEEFCTPNPLDRTLICRNVPTPALEAGDYQFDGQLIPNQDGAAPSENQQTNRIEIAPEPVFDLSLDLRINGETAPPKWVQPRSSDEDSLVIAWTVEGGRNVKVELLPAPGTVPREGEITYRTPQEAGRETVTLQVTDEEGNQQQRSVVIETPSAPRTPDPLMIPPGLLDDGDRDPSSDGEGSGDERQETGDESGDASEDESGDDSAKDPPGKFELRRRGQDEPLRPIEIEPRFR